MVSNEVIEELIIKYQSIYTIKQLELKEYLTELEVALLELERVYNAKDSKLLYRLYGLNDSILEYVVKKYELIDELRESVSSYINEERGIY